jgi:uncharacterized membrane protein
MIRLTLASLTVFAVAAILAWRLGGALGGGVLAGYLLGAGFSGLGVLYQRHTLLTRPEATFQAFTVAFLAKLVVLVLGALTFRFVEVAAARADWRSFLIAFAVAVAVIVPLGSFDLLQALRRRSPELPAESEAR